MARAEILALLQGQKAKIPPAFSGLVQVTAEGLKREGLEFHQIHRRAKDMARAAASTFKLTGLPSATVPFDLCVPAEALGAPMDFREGGFFEFPRPIAPRFSHPEEIRSVSIQSALEQARLPEVYQALAALKADIGTEAVIGAILPGPFTILSQLVENGALFLEMKRNIDVVQQALTHLAMFLAYIGQAYRVAGADFLTIHEMGGSPSFLGPIRFEMLVWPALQALLEHLPSPRVLAVCGKVESITALLARAKAEALSVDQTNDLRQLRAALPNAIIFGNLDPVQVLANTQAEQVRNAAQAARAAGVDAIWPGCDLYPPTPLENLKALLAHPSQ